MSYLVDTIWFQIVHDIVIVIVHAFMQLSSSVSKFQTSTPMVWVSIMINLFRCLATSPVLVHVTVSQQLGTARQAIHP